jgi:hypothetical protein
VQDQRGEPRRQAAGRCRPRHNGDRGPRRRPGQLGKR